MYKAVLDLCDEKNTLIESLTEFPQLVDMLRVKADVIEYTGGLDAQLLPGIITSKPAQKKILCQTAIVHTTALSVYINSLSNPGLKGKNNYSYEDLMQSDDDELILIMQRIYEDIDNNLVHLIKYDISTTTLADFAELIANYNDPLPATELIANQHKTYSDQLEALFNETDKLLKTGMDKLVLQFKTINPEFYYAYKNNRVIADTAVPHGETGNNF
jgi:hypothetical protein